MYTCADGHENRARIADSIDPLNQNLDSIISIYVQWALSKASPASIDSSREGVRFCPAYCITFIILVAAKVCLPFTKPFSQ